MYTPGPERVIKSKSLVYGVRMIFNFFAEVRLILYQSEFLSPTRINPVADFLFLMFNAFVFLAPLLSVTLVKVAFNFTPPSAST